MPVSRTVPSASSRRRSATVRLLAVGAGVAMTGTLLSACGGGSDSGSSDSSSKTLVFANWADAETTTRPGIEALIKQFEKANPGVTIKNQAISFTDIGHTLLLRTQSGNPPDVAEISGNDLHTVAATGAVQDLDGIAPQSYQDSLLPSAKKASTIDGKLVGAPWTTDTVGFWYNRTLMKKAGLDPNKPPTTTDELLDDLAAIKAKEPSVIGLGLDTTNRAFSLAVHWPWMKTFGAQPFDGDTPNADTKPMKQYLTFMRTLAKKGYIQTGHKIGDFRPLAAQDRVAFVWDQAVLQGVVQATNHQSAAQFYQTWGLTTQPTGSTGKPFTVDQGHQSVMFAKTKNKKLAWKFMQFLSTSNESIVGYGLKYESTFPALKQPPAGAAKALDNPVYQAFSQKISPTAVVPEYGQHFDDAYSPVMAGLQSAVSGSTSIDKIASDIQSQLKSAFQ